MFRFSMADAFAEKALLSRKGKHVSSDLKKNHELKLRTTAEIRTTNFGLEIIG